MRTPKKIGKAIAKRVKSWIGTTTTKGAAIEESRTFNMPEDVEEVKVEVKEQTNVTETDIQLCEDINKNSEDFQLIFESNEETQNNSTTVEPTSEPCFDRETNEQTPDSPSPTEPCFDATDEKNKPLTQQRQAILAGVVGAILLANCVALYIMKMPAVAVVVGIVGLVCVSYALYNALKPGTKLEKVEDVEQPIVESSLNPT